MQKPVLRNARRCAACWFWRQDAVEARGSSISDVLKPVLRRDSATPRYIYNWGTKGVAVRYYCEIGVKLDGVRAYRTSI